MNTAAIIGQHINVSEPNNIVVYMHNSLLYEPHYYIIMLLMLGIIIVGTV